MVPSGSTSLVFQSQMAILEGNYIPTLPMPLMPLRFNRRWRFLRGTTEITTTVGDDRHQFQSQMAILEGNYPTKINLHIKEGAVSIADGDS